MKYRVNTKLQFAQVVADLILLFTALLASSGLRVELELGNPVTPTAAWDEWQLYLLLGAIWLISSLVNKTYQRRANGFAYYEIAQLVRTGFATTLVLAGVLYLTTRDVSRLRFWYFAGLALVLLIAHRLIVRTGYRVLFHRTWGSAIIAAAKVVVVGEGQVLYDTLVTLSTCDPKEVAVVGFLDYEADFAEFAGSDDQGTYAAAFQAAPPRSSSVSSVAVDIRESSATLVARAVETELEPSYPVRTRASERAALLEAERVASRATFGEATDEERMVDSASALAHAIEKLVLGNAADNVVLAMSRHRHSLLSRVVSDIQRLPVHIALIPDVADLTILNVGVSEIGNSAVLKLRAPVLTEVQLFTKRLLDLFLVSLFLPLLLPIMTLVALAIRLDSPGPIVFRQRRVGQYGREFTIFKFRTMVVDAEQRLREITTFTADGKPLFKSEGRDPRVTRVGRILRRLSLDELPQLFNVLMGHMSLVGPRPELPRYVGYYDTWQHFRLWVPPGITGWWQVKGRERQPMYMHWDDDIYYIKHYSILLDIHILWLTISSAVFGSTGR